jgi:hypothetical protein
MVEEAEVAHQTEEIAEAHRHERFNRMVAVTVAIVALSMVLGKIKDENLQRRTMVALIQDLDDWNYYQAKSLKQHMFELEDQHWQLMESLFATAPAPVRQQMDSARQDWSAQGSKEKKEGADLQTKAQAEETNLEGLKEQSHDFHFAEALLTLAITLFAVSALTRGRWLYALGLAIAILGAALELAGFLGLSVHPSFLQFLT